MHTTNPNRSLLRDGHALTIYALKTADVLAVYAAGVLAYLLRFDTLDAVPPPLYLYALLAGVLLALVVFSELGVYRTWRSGAKAAMYGRALLGWCVVLAVLASLTFLSKTGTAFSRLWFAYWAVLGLFGIVAVRLIARSLVRWLHARGVGVRRVALVGPHDNLQLILQRLHTAPWVGFRPVLLCCDGGHAQNDTENNLPGGGGEVAVVSLVNLGKALAEHHVDEIWLAWPMREEVRIRETIGLLENQVLNIRWLPDIFAYRMINHGVTELAGMPMLDLSVSPLSGINRLVKEVEDRVLAVVILILISPVLLICAIGVKLSSPGPVLFKQLRHGWDGREIEVWKFRSMRPHKEEGGQVTQAKRGDSRVTPFGAFLRRTSLDELPQFFNVLQGRMSIVGPRPHALAHNEQYKALIPNYLLRHRVKPGITGWAQVNGLRGETDTLEKMQSRVEFDLYYIEHWSVWFDLKIIWRTAATVLFDRNAY